MAGAGFKTFIAGAVLGATDLNTYLMQQSTMVFASGTARSSAITSPSEGMVSYITDVDQIQTYNGSAWLPQPYAQAAGTADATTSALAADAIETITITFPTGRFSVAPIISLSSGSSRYQFGILSISALSANVQVRNVSAATGTSTTIYYQATQMSSTSAGG